jgi:mRNA-degrading endonuclease toxin of MazEF toxin-antitoxin module
MSGEARKLVVIASRDSINSAGMNVIVARVTAQERHRELPSTVIVDPERETGLNVRSYVLCHDLTTLPPEVIEPERHGTLPIGKLIEFRNALRYSLDVD